MALNNKEILGFIALAVALCFSIFMRHNDFNEGVGVRNLEAPYHVLLTATALNEGEFKHHWFLPIVSLGQLKDKNIPWGATQPTKNGDYVYTSFTAPGFLIPYLWFKSFNLEPTVKHLAYLNAALGSASALLLYSLILSLLSLNGITGWPAVFSGLLGTSIGIFSNEALTSHGVLYWSQSLYQSILIASLFILIKVLQQPDCKKYQILLAFAAFIGSVTEWAGYVFNFGLIALFWFAEHERNRCKAIALQIFAVT